MRRKVSLVAFVLTACSWVGDGGVAQPRAAVASCRVKTQAVAVNTVVVAPVPLAVAIGVPVAEVTPYYYSYSAYSAYAPTPAPTVDVDALATKLAEKLVAAGSGGHGGNVPQPTPPNPPQPNNVAAPPLIGQKCAQCHSGPGAKRKTLARKSGRPRLPDAIESDSRHLIRKNAARRAAADARRGWQTDRGTCRAMNWLALKVAGTLRVPSANADVAASIPCAVRHSYVTAHGVCLLH